MTHGVADMLMNQVDGMDRVSGRRQAMAFDADAPSFAAELDARSDTDRVREAAEQLVGIALIKPLLEQARENPFKTELFHGGPGEEAFGAQLDQHLADRMAKRAGGSIVDAVMNRWNQNFGGKEIDTRG